MTVQDIVDFKMKVGKSGEASSITRTSIEVTISDSIYHLSPEITIVAPDPVGTLAGVRAGAAGTPWTFELDTGRRSVEYPFMTDHGEIQSFKDGSASMSGQYRIVLRHSFIYQPSVVKAYPSKSPSVVVQQIVNEFGSRNFSSVDFVAASSLDMDYIYNPSLTPAEFIERILLPLSSATTDAINNPYYVFIDARNRFRYVPLLSLMNKKPDYTILVSNQAQLDPDDYPSDSYTRAIGAVPFTQEYSKIFNVIDTETCRLEDGSFEKVDTSYRKLVDNQSLPFYEREKSVVQYMSEDHFQDSKEMLRFQAGKNFENRRAYLYDKLLVSTLLNLDFCAGQTVNLEVYEGLSDFQVESYSGTYLIESSSHHWTAEMNSGTTQLVLASPNPSIKGTLLEGHAYKGE